MIEAPSYLSSPIVDCRKGRDLVDTNYISSMYIRKYIYMLGKGEYLGTWHCPFKKYMENPRFYNQTQ
jgi:hypothetical protein